MPLHVHFTPVNVDEAIIPAMVPKEFKPARPDKSKWVYGLVDDDKGWLPFYWDATYENRRKTGRWVCLECPLFGWEPHEIVIPREEIR